MKNDRELVRKAMELYLVTDRRWLNGKPLQQAVFEAIEGGVTCIQLREKHIDNEEFIKIASSLQLLCQDCHIPLIINDNVEVMLQVDADGIHVGQSDMDAMDVRNKIGENKILGVSVQTKDQALLAEQAGADYLGVGAVFNTNTKTDAADVTYDTLKEICQSVNIPVVAIGGIDVNNMMNLKGSHIDGIAVVSAIMAKDNIIGATHQLKEKCEELFND